MDLSGRKKETPLKNTETAASRIRNAIERGRVNGFMVTFKAA
jgi:hypothetical protein